MFGKLKQARPAPVERRGAMRKPMRFGSKIAYSGCDFLISCVVRDFSPMGAGITLEAQQQIPDSVHLIDFRTLLVYEARVAWRKPPDFGLQFVRTYRSDEVPSEAVREIGRAHV